MKRVLVLCAVLALAPASATFADTGYFGSGHRSDCGGQPCTGTSTTSFLDFLRSLFSFGSAIDINESR